MGRHKFRIALVVHNVRSALNVGSLLRSADGFSIDEVYLTGYTPYPVAPDDSRLPHQARKTTMRIHKTALGAEDFINWHYRQDIHSCLEKLRLKGFFIVALEQASGAIDIDKYEPSEDIALVVGSETAGLETSVLKQVDLSLQIPMGGRKESFNVAVAAGIALYHLRFPGSYRQKQP
jgi:23S rRNA (guanosine2251-2'-O)-methyltransferase